MLLSIIRHADAATNSPDHQRCLTQAGRAHAIAQGIRLRNFITPDILLYSDAKRTTQTANLLGFGCTHIALRELYGAWIGQALEVLKEYGEENTVLVGHEPLVSALGFWLTTEINLERGVPTGTVILAEGELAPGGMRLVELFS